MKEQLSFDLSMLRRKSYILATIGILDIMYILCGFLYGYLDMRIISVGVLVVNSLITCLILQGVGANMNRQGTFQANFYSCMYFPTTRKIYIGSRYLITLGILMVQFLVSVVAFEIGSLTFEQGLQASTLGIVLTVTLIAICFGSVIHVLIGFIAQNNQRISIFILAFCGGFLGAGIHMQEEMRTYQWDKFAIILLICVGVWLLFYPILHRIAKWVHV